MSFWYLANIFWLILFVIGTIFVRTMEIDGTGAVQTPEVKLMSFIVLMSAFAFPVIIQGVWLIVNLTINKRKNLILHRK